MEAGVVWMGFASNAGECALDWRGGFRLQYRLAYMDVPHSGPEPDRHSSDTPECALRGPRSLPLCKEPDVLGDSDVRDEPRACARNLAAPCCGKPHVHAIGAAYADRGT